MSIKWTNEQLKVINTRNRNLLVSAAAGSGKTAVLVERIIQMITDENNPIDIDSLLVVTFTNAAASEMRERIGEALEKKVTEQPTNIHLHRQMALLQHASITTIHSFCLSILRNYFYLINLDPSFRVADETELTLLKSDVLKELLENYYKIKDENFYKLVESYSTNRSDQPLEDLILKLYLFAKSYPWPEDWLNEQVRHLNITTIEELQQKEWFKIILGYIKETCTGLLEDLNYAYSLTKSKDGPFMYCEMLEEELLQLENICHEKDYNKLYNLFKQLTFKTLSRKKSDKVDKNIRETVKQIRTKVKKTLENIRESYFLEPIEVIMDDICTLKPVIETLIQVVINFSKEYQQAKIDKNIIDFNDLEHLALKILIKKDDNTGEEITSNIAKELQEQYVEIMIDEYQDSNLVQEKLLSSVSRIGRGEPNIFMVGDVKQSIYKFRLAKPELFMKKYDIYTLEESIYQKIDLHKNFRSRKSVIESVNFFFYQLMSKKAGDVQYDDNTALYEAANYKKCLKGNHAGDTELLIIETKNKSDEELDTEYTTKELEARMIAKRIKKMIEDEDYHIYDRQIDNYRQIMYKDMVILLRTMANWADTFVEILAQEGIPAYTDTSTGYFETVEVKVVINFLKILDNPRQDIPLLSVLRSPIGGFSDEELAIIRSNYKKYELYDSLILYQQERLQNELSNKLDNFLNKLSEWRGKVPYLSIQELLYFIFDQTNYYNYVSMMTEGKQRQANLDMLIEKAIKFEKSSYKGLFNFIRFLDKLKKYNVDFGEASILGENENLVRIMTIHKSKGLEFPVVFVSGLSKKFNFQDLKESVIIHPELGIGTDFINHKLRYKKPTILKKAIQKKLEIENLSEELRVLYVALTRACEKLILTATITANTSIDKKMEKWSQVLRCQKIELPISIVLQARSFLDFIMFGILRHQSANVLIDEYVNIATPFNDLNLHKAKFEIKKYSLDTLITEEIVEQVEDIWLKDYLLNWDSKTEYDNKAKEEINRRLKWEYRYKDEINVHVKMSVSEIKRQGMEDDEFINISDRQKDSILPKFIKQKDKLSATQRGTLMHKIMQYLDLESMKNYNTLNNALQKLVEKQYIQQKDKDSIYLKDLLDFRKTDLANRMVAAEQEGLLFKERQFVLGVQAKEINTQLTSDEIVLIQGVIDCYFEEDGELVLIDYKTDYIQKGEEYILTQRYKDQMAYYKKALTQITQKKVKECILYSFSLSKPIQC